jgi:uncharacterized phiE125 gp8 family phage protein
MALTTVARCKAFRNIEGDNQEHDAELARLIVAAQAFLEEECGRVFDQGTVTEYYHGDDWRDRLMVKRPPITSVTNIWDDPARAFTSPISASRYAIDDADAGLIRLLDGLTFSKGIRNIKITYVGGFAQIPEDLEQAAIELVWAAREKGANNLIGVRSRSIADGNVQFVNLDWGSVNLAPIISKYSLRTGVA